MLLEGSSMTSLTCGFVSTECQLAQVAATVDTAFERLSVGCFPSPTAHIVVEQTL